VARLLALSSPVKGDMTEMFSSPDNSDNDPMEVLEAALAGLA
jgi:hypothetical protein